MPQLFGVMIFKPESQELGLPHFLFAIVCLMIFAHSVHCVIHFTLYSCNYKLLSKQYLSEVYPRHFLLCLYTMPHFRVLIFFIYFTLRKLYSGGPFSRLSHLKKKKLPL